MTDDFRPRLSGLDGERPLPPAVRERLEAALMAVAAGETPAPLTGEVAAAAAGGPLPLDGPRPLPAPLRSRLERALLDRRATPHPRRRISPALLSLAAVLVLVLATFGLVRGVGLGRSGGGDPDVTAAGPSASRPPDAGPGTPDSPVIPTAGPADDVTSTTAAPTARPGSRSAQPSGPSKAAEPPGGTSGSAGREPGTSAGPPRPGQPPATTADPFSGTGRPGPGPQTENGGAGPAGPAGTGQEDAGPPPPYAFPAAPAASADATSGSGGPQPSRSAPPQPGPATTAPRPAGTPASSGPVRLAVVGGDPSQEAGFRAYVDLLNRNGGVRGRTVELVSAGPGSPAGGALATVNLSARPIASAAGAPGWASGPVLETLTATEDLLTGRVFSFASPPERQGHLVADAVFPEAAPGATAVIYTALDGPLSGPVPRAIEAVLRERGVVVTSVPYDPAHPPARFVAADAAFLSLDREAAKTWLGQARQSRYSPRRGVAGIYSLFDPALLPDLPEGARMVSPYVVPAGDEGEAIRSGAGAPSAAVLHGWATAKSLAVALWRSGAGTPEAMQAAVEGLAGYDSGLAPPYETRPNTRSRTPEGVLYEARSGAFTLQGGFRRDQH